MLYNITNNVIQYKQIEFHVNTYKLSNDPNTITFPIVTYQYNYLSVYPQILEVCQLSLYSEPVSQGSGSDQYKSSDHEL